ncbi:MAG: pantetheine-phosphate adenylyltransferase [Planctomycetes bacterium]|nr:pantetheine-phosphate adenylyltransferase [Planctomycetota bacterium]NBY03344.1 pantetheine-phosphate adenylyltransferase [Planctomycetota bacterium]
MKKNSVEGMAVYPGTFDPIHFGHLDIIERGSKVFPQLLVGVGINPDKSTLFSLKERVELVKQTTSHLSNVTVLPFENLVVHFVKDSKSKLILRGMRTTSDMDYEFTMSLANMALDPDIETVFLLAKDIYSHLSSSLLKQIAVLGGDLSKFIPSAVAKAMLEKIRHK